MSLRQRIRGYVDSSIDRADKSKELEVVETSWHFRLYRWWMSMGGRNKVGYRENFCHYVRVVLIWVPTFWFFKYRLGNTFIRPWMIATIAAFLTFLITVYLLAPGLFWQGVVAVAFGAAIIGLLIGIWFLDDYMKDNHYRGWDLLKDRLALILVVVLVVGLFPITIPMGLALLLDKQTHKRYGEGGWAWFFTHGYIKVVFPWVVAAIVATALSFYFLGFWITLTILGAIIGVVLIVAAAVLLIIGLIILNERTSTWRHQKIWAIQDRLSSARPSKPYVPEKPKGTPLRHLIFAFILSKKRKICPFIGLPEGALPNNRPTALYWD